MVRYYEANGVPLERIDNTGCMFGVAGTCYARRTSAWKSMLLLEHARGGWMNVYYGNLELLDDTHAKWFAKVQHLFFELQSFGRTYPFGSLPGLGEPYGFCSMGKEGSLYTVVNPSQSQRRVRLQRLHRLQPALSAGRIQFRDAGFKPVLEQNEILLGPEQLAVVGFGEYARPRYDLGVQQDVIIPQEIRPLIVEFREKGTNAIAGVVTAAPLDGDLRIVMRQTADGKPVRSSEGAPPNGTTLGKILRLEAMQTEQSLPIRIEYDKAIWSGLSWAVGEVWHRDLKPGVPINIRCFSLEKKPVKIKVELYVVNYGH
jgi:hypothetical protein